MVRFLVFKILSVGSTLAHSTLPWCQVVDALYGCEKDRGGCQPHSPHMIQQSHSPERRTR